jgi:hypothetical protein
MATKRRAARLIGAAAICWVLAGLIHLAVPMVFGQQPIGLHVRWASNVAPAERVRLEERFHLADGQLRDGSTWDYVLLDPSSENIRALVEEPAAEDTTSLDRNTFQPLPGISRLTWRTPHPLVPGGLVAVSVLLALGGALFLVLAALEGWQASAARASVVEKSLDAARSAGSRLGAAAVVLAILAPVGVFASMYGAGTYSDEVCYSNEVRLAWRGDWSSMDCSSTLPGYAIIVAGVSRSLGLPDTLDSVRLVTAVFSAVMFGAFALCAVSIGSQPGLKTLQFVALPILLPYTGLLYTDVVALLGLLLAAVFAVRGRSLEAALWLTVTLAVRQTHIVWGALLLPMCWDAVGLWPGTPGDWKSLHAWRQRARQAWPFAIPLLAFGGFVAWNGGIAVGDAQAHEAGIFAGNVIFAGLLLAIFFAPQVLAAVWRRRRSPAAWLVAAVCLLLVLSRFAVTHPYNQGAESSFLRNRALLWFASGQGPKTVLALCVALAAFAMTTARVRLKIPLLLTAAFSMVPFDLIEQRYAIPAFAFFILLREPEGQWPERAGLAVMASVAVFFVWGIASRAFNL